ncbi:MAG: HepT-like ribonuclease domain-containing protein [Sediminibacterium sp.]
MRSKLGDKERLRHILDFCVEIGKIIKDYDDEKFQNDFLVRAAVCSYIIWIGEASAHITAETKKKSEVDWTNVKGMRNIITHEYFGIDYKTVFNSITEYLPPLKKSVEELLKDFE